MGKLRMGLKYDHLLQQSAYTWVILVIVSLNVAAHQLVKKNPRKYF